MDLTVNINKDDLLTKLEENKVTHEQDYTEAHTKWVDEVKKQMKKNLEEFEQEPDRSLLTIRELPEPTTHLADYDRAIRMISRHVGRDVQLSEESFRQYWDDEWHWKQNFIQTASNYISKTWL